MAQMFDLFGTATNPQNQQGFYGNNFEAKEDLLIATKNKVINFLLSRSKTQTYQL